MIEHIPEMVTSGIDSFKIEGRMKTALYVATVARTYRLAIDDFLKDPEIYKSRIPFYKSEIQKCTYRQYTTASSLESQMKIHRYMTVIHSKGIYISWYCWRM